MAATNLPIQLTNFIGRERELDDVRELLSTARLVTLTGPGGSGKTRLALQAAAGLEGELPDGVWFVDLAALRDPALVAQTVGQVLDLRLAPDQPVLEALSLYLRSRRLLLILDNCEHLLETCAQLVRQMLTQADGLSILATSREPLAVAGESVYLVPGLGWPDLAHRNRILPYGSGEPHGSGELQALLDFDAVRLFVHRARLVSPSFKLSAENAPAVVEICRRLDGLPLALELAGARANVLSVQEIVAFLNDRFGLLVANTRSGGQPRHLTLRYAVDWSYDLLSAAEKLLLNRLAVFLGGFTLEMVAAVCSLEDEPASMLVDRLSALVTKSFVVAETSGRSQTRFRLLETIREYACGKLSDSGEAEDLHHRHLDYFMVQAEEAGPKLGDAYQRLWLNWLEAEHDNLRAALDWALACGRIEDGLRICLSIIRFWEIRGYIPEAMRWFQRFLEQPDAAISTRMRIDALTYAAHIAMFLAETETAKMYAQEAVALAEALEPYDPALLFRALGGLSSSAEAGGDYQEAFEIGVRLFALLPQVTISAFELGMNYLGSGHIAVEAGQYAHARQWLGESLRLARKDGDDFRLAHTYSSLGKLAVYEADYPQARGYLEQSVALLRRLDARHDLAATLRSLGQIYLLEGDTEAARSFFLESLAAHQAEQNVTGMLECLVGLGAAAVAGGRALEGARLLIAAEALRGLRRGYIWPARRMEIEPYLSDALGRLSVSERKAAAVPLPLEAALAYAHQFQPEPAQDEPGESGLAALSEREREVAILIAQGKTNAQIAQSLVLSKRTVEKHSANILMKLGLENRTQVARWALEQGMLQPSDR